MAAVHRFVIRYHLRDGDWVDHPLEVGEVLIGREESSGLVLNHHLVSRQHANLLHQGDKFWLTDLGSTNGTILDNILLAPHIPYPVQPGQSIRIGDFEILLVESLAAPLISHPSAEVDHVEPVESQTPAHGVQFRYGLNYRQGNGNWQTTPLSEAEFIIGRNLDCQLMLEDQKVSRRHVRIDHQGDRFWLLDLGSTNGTQLEGEPLPPRQKFPLYPGQIFQVGSFSLSVSNIEQAAGKVGHSVHKPLKVPIIPGVPATEAGDQMGIQTMLGDADLFKSPAVLHGLDLSQFDQITIGRSQDNHIVLNHPMVSRYHATIERVGGRHLLRDLHSSNGIFVNGVRSPSERWLQEEDEIRIGPYVFELIGLNLRQKADSGLCVQVSGVKQFVSRQINLLQDINLVIQPFEFVAIVGMSGSGKTTLMNAISGYRPATHGHVLINQIDLYSSYDVFRNDIGYVPQKDIVHTELTPAIALEYVARLRMPSDSTAGERSAVVTEVLENLGLSERRDIPISRLSGGQLKRVSIGVELVTKPRLFFLDEPTSGLDPGTEYGMMKLLRHLADQGRTVILVTHATKNVMLCDKVVFLASGGYVAFYGPPDEALQYFDEFRTARERKEKQMEFDDIYRILSDEERGSAIEWDRRYRRSKAYRQYAKLEDVKPLEPKYPAASQRQNRLIPASARSKNRRVSALRQFMILSMRNLKILIQDKISLALMLALAPILGLMDFIWGPDLFDPVSGDAAKIITMWFMMGLITILVGALSSVREIVKEADIYQRERAVNQKILPYVLSKVWVGVVLGLYQAVMLLLAKIIFVHPNLPGAEAYLQLYVTLFLGTVCGYLIGLAISAGAPNQNSAMMLIIVVLVPQFLFAGALLPLDLIPGGEQISLIMPTRWVFESFIRINGLGEALVEDPCWELSKADRMALSEDDKANCTCLGENIFTRCATFPGILSTDFYDMNAKSALEQAEPLEPPIPTAHPYPTAYPSPTALPTPTMLPSPTPLPTPADPREMGTYMDQRSAQGDEYQDQILSQFDEYRLDSQEQGEIYSQVRTSQGDEYAALREAQGEEYSEDMRAYGDLRAEWQESREKSISSAEGVLGAIYDNYAHTMKGSLWVRWAALVAINAVLLMIVLVFQKRKDRV